MKKLYEAIGTRKREYLEFINNTRAFDINVFQQSSIGISDIVMICRMCSIPTDSIDTHWCLNSILPRKKEDEDVLVFEPLEMQFDTDNISSLNEVNTHFKHPIKLSKKAIILVPEEKYDKLFSNPDFEKKYKNMDVRCYVGEEDLAVKMLMGTKGYIYLYTDEDGYVISKGHSDLNGYAETLKKLQKKLMEEKSIVHKKNEEHKKIDKSEEDEKNNYRMITGLTSEVEGDIQLDDELYGATSIGKTRENQEDAILLIKNSQNPSFKMMVLADGIGGWSHRRNCE